MASAQATVIPSTPAMANTTIMAPATEPLSPVSTLLRTLGLTRDDLSRRSSDMREYLQDGRLAFEPPPPSNPKRRSRSTSQSQVKQQNAMPATVQPPPPPPPPEISTTPVKTEPIELPNVLPPLPKAAQGSMEAILDRKHHDARRAKRARRDRERDRFTEGASPSPSPTRNYSSGSQVSPNNPASRHASRTHLDDGEHAFGMDGAESDASSLHSDYISHDQYVGMLGNTSRRTSTSSNASHYRTASSIASNSSGNQAVSGTEARVSPMRYYRDHTLPRVDNGSASCPPQPAAVRPSIFPQTPRKPLVPPGAYDLPSSSPYGSPPSSPGPMPPAAPTVLPFTLPPGPYSKKKPELSYAALIGRAILATTNHRLTLQEIYEYITIVFPHYTREEQTWQNSVRHVLSTTPCFRKCPRERGEGKTQWAIWDKDLKCFEGGGFDKRFCDDVPSKKTAGMKRVAIAAASAEIQDTDHSGGKSRKRRKVDDDMPSTPELSTEPALAPLPPLFPMIPRPGSSSSSASSTHPYHTPYYAPTGSTTRLVRTDVLFPPLPPSAALARRLPHLAVQTQADNTSCGSSSPVDLGDDALTVQDVQSNRSCSPPPPWSEPTPSSPVSLASSPPSSSAIPELMAASEELTSSSSPPMLSETETEGGAQLVQDLISDEQLRDLEAALSSDESEPFIGEDMEMPMLLKHSAEDRRQKEPVRLPSRSPSVDFGEYMNFTPIGLNGTDTGAVLPGGGSVKGKMKAMQVFGSPTPGARSARKFSGNSSDALAPSLFPIPRIGTSPSISPSRRGMTTPPPKARSGTFDLDSLGLSPQRTPVSHMGVHMSPNASLAHFKTHLDPPQPAAASAFRSRGDDASSNGEDGLAFGPFLGMSSPGADESLLLRTPSRKPVSFGSGKKPRSTDRPGMGMFPPVTPQKLFPSLTDVTYGVGTSGGLSSMFSFSENSPFRTPTKRARTTSSSGSYAATSFSFGADSIFAMHEHGTALDDELARLNAAYGGADSPAGGLFGKDAKGLLYESPSAPSPGTLSRYWSKPLEAKVEL